MNHDFSNRLLLLPLFQGFSRLDFLDLAAKVPLDVRSLPAGSDIVTAGEMSDALVCLLEGEAIATATAPDGSYLLREWLRAPWLCQPECLYGLHPRYGLTLTAATSVGILRIDKAACRTLTELYPAFRLNMLNRLCTLAQDRRALLWQSRSERLDLRFASFLAARCLRPAGRKELQIRMTALGDALGATRLNVSRMLAALETQGLLHSGRARIDIPKLELLPRI